MNSTNPLSFFGSNAKGEIELNPIFKIRMPSGITVSLPEMPERHLARCLHCRKPGSLIAWSVAIRGERRAIRVSQREIGKMVGTESSSGLVEAIGAENHWLRLAPRLMKERKDIALDQYALHDHHALIGSLRASCAPAWWERNQGDWTESDPRAPQDKDDPATYLLGPQEEEAFSTGCFYCETYRYDPKRPLPFLPRQIRSNQGKLLNWTTRKHVENLIQQKLTPDIEMHGSPSKLIHESMTGVRAHVIRDLTHALSLNWQGNMDPLPLYMIVGERNVYIWERRQSGQKDKYSNIQKTRSGAS